MRLNNKSLNKSAANDTGRTKMSTTATILKADTRKSTSLLKKYLKEAFGIKVSVRSEFYSMGCSLNISYSLGTDQKLIDAVCDKLKYGAFDSMQDLSYNIDNEGLIVDGYQLEDFKHVFVRQEISTELFYKFAKMLSDSITFQGVPALNSIEEFHTSFPQRYGSAWNWSDMIRQYFSTRNFSTQDESKIVIKSIVEERIIGGSYDLEFIYEVNGVEYSTRTGKVIVEVIEETITIQPIKVSELKDFSDINPRETKVEIVDYSEKAIAVIGDTKKIKDKLKELGGKFNAHLKCGAGWIFPKTKLDTLILAINQ